MPGAAGLITGRALSRAAGPKFWLEPRQALDGGADGLRDYRALLKDAVRVVRPGGLVAVEIGFDQRADAIALFEEAGLVGIGSKRDLAGHDRVVFGAVASANG